MEKPYKKHLVLAVRILIFGLFILSAVAKMYPLWAFEKQLVDLGIADWCGAHYLARVILGIEIAAGIAILQNHFILYSPYYSNGSSWCHEWELRLFRSVDTHDTLGGIN